MTWTPLRAFSGQAKLVVGLVGGAEFINHMYLVLFPPILGRLAAEFDTSLAMIGLAMGVGGATNMLFQLPFGYLTDNYNRTIGYVLSLSIGSLGVFVSALAPSYAGLVLGQAILGIGIAGHHPSHYPLLSDVTPPKLRGRAFSIRGFAGNLGFGAPALLITGLVQFPGVTWRHALALIGLFGVAYLVISSYVLREFIATEVKYAETEETQVLSIRERILAESRVLLVSPAILALTLLALITSLASWGVTTYTIVHLTESYGVGQEIANFTLSTMFGLGAIMILIGGHLTDKLSTGKILITSYVAVFVFVGLFAWTILPAYIAVGCVIVVGAVRGVSGPPRSKLADKVSKRGALGKNFAMISVGLMAGNALGPPLFGAIVDFGGVQNAFWAITVTAALATLITISIVLNFSDELATPSIDLAND